MKTTKMKVYEAPQTEIIEFESQGILCASAGAATTTSGGGTTNMNVQNGYGW